MTVQIKICGLKSPLAINTAIDEGATHIGLVHFANSPRHVSLEMAATLREMIGDRAKAVLLLVNASVEETGHAIDTVKPDIVQFHGKETPEWTSLVRQKGQVEVWKALGVRSAETLANSARFEGKIDRLLFDAPAPKPAADGTQPLPGGNGVSFRWELLKEFEHTIPWGLAGGLTPENVAEAIQLTGAELVDTSSGVETGPGIKDVDKIKAFCQAAKSA
ncbi:MAG: phosphoribosylanthranilate isomerase [Pseudomonadota bacterium]